MSKEVIGSVRPSLWPSLPCEHDEDPSLPSKMYIWMRKCGFSVLVCSQLSIGDKYNRGCFPKFLSWPLAAQPLAFTHPFRLEGREQAVQCGLLPAIRQHSSSSVKQEWHGTSLACALCELKLKLRSHLSALPCVSQRGRERMGSRT